MPPSQASTSALRRSSIVDEATPLIVTSVGNPFAITDKDKTLIGHTTADPTQAGANEEAIDDDYEEEDDDRPLPKLQIILLSYARAVENLAFFCIFPFINKMIVDTGDIETVDVGFYSGVIESCFSATQMVLMLPWGRAADRFGRRPVLLFSLAGMTVSVASFGLSQSVVQMIVMRCVAGMFGGLIITVRCMISELSTKRTQATAFSWYAIAGNIGIMIGPIIGGSLAEPAKYLPSVFGGVWFFETYPYALPTMASGLLALSAFILCAFFVEETLPSSKASSSSSSSSAATITIQKDPPSPMSVLQKPGIPAILFIYTTIMTIAFAYTAILPLYLFTPVRYGGCNLPPPKISLFMVLAGLVQTIYMLLIFPRLHARVGTIGILTTSAVTWPMSFFLFPVGSILLRFGHHTTAFWIIQPLILVLLSAVAMTFAAVQLALNDVSPSPEALGTLNALALVCVSGLRSVAPAAASSAYAWGVGNRILGGYFGWVLLLGLGLMYSVSLRWLPKRAYGRVNMQKNKMEDGDGIRRNQARP